MFLIVKSGLKYLINDYIDSGSRPFSRRLQYLLQQLEAIYNKMVKKLQRLCELMRPPCTIVHRPECQLRKVINFFKFNSDPCGLRYWPV